MQVRRLRPEETTGGARYDLTYVAETNLMHIIVGLQKVLKEYEADLLDPKFEGAEDQEFLLGEIEGLRTMIERCGEYIEVTETGFQIH